MKKRKSVRRYYIGAAAALLVAGSSYLMAGLTATWNGNGYNYVITPGTLFPVGNLQPGDTIQPGTGQSLVITSKYYYAE